MTMTMVGGRRRPARRWLLAPSLICVALTLLFAVPLRVFGLALPEPVFPLAVAFAWSALRPSIVAPAALLALGLFLDLLWGAPLGLWPVCLLVAHALTLLLRRLLSGEDFGVLWVWYVAMCAVAFGVAEAAMAAITGTWPNLVAVSLQALPTVALFPLAWRMIERYQVDDNRSR